MENASLKVSKEVWGKLKVYCVMHGIKIQEWVEGILIAAMDNNQAPTTFAPTPQQATIDSLKAPSSRSVSSFAVPKKETALIGEHGDGIVLESDTE